MTVPRSKPLNSCQSFRAHQCDLLLRGSGYISDIHCAMKAAKDMETSTDDVTRDKKAIVSKEDIVLVLLLSVSREQFVATATNESNISCRLF